ncbi:hypothetical protein [Sulfurimonas sp.]|uniref:hypothetical protein n=1 Tax=Sulfurimonas sp. TaxID=2022749 RepID=UPI0035620ABB
MFVYIDDRKDEELEDDYGYDYGCEEEYDYDYDSQKTSYDYVESDESYLGDY